MLGNVNTLLEDINSNKKYLEIFEQVETKYFSPSFNFKIDTVLGEYQHEDLIKYYLGYKEILDDFLIKVINNKNDELQNLYPHLKAEEVKVITLLIYKEIDFLVLKIETILNLDESPLEIITTNEGKNIIVNKESMISITEEQINILRHMAIKYYYSNKKIESFYNFINN